MSGHHYEEGHTLAGWTGCAVAVLGLSTAGAGMCLGSGPALWSGVGITGLGVLVTWGLHLAGWGKPSGIRPPAERSWRVRDPAARAGHPDCLGCRLAGRGRGRAHRRGRVAVPDVTEGVLPISPSAARSEGEPVPVSVSTPASMSVPVSTGETVRLPS
ncbi:HGxxPAAW family protein [Streptomyces tauricus]|uniref:HGxxPAAW family protein n=1 Tax=Streptomyces tauricus TaxID=68274 RepID=UPI00387F3150